MMLFITCIYRVFVFLPLNILQHTSKTINQPDQTPTNHILYMSTQHNAYVSSPDASPISYLLQPSSP